ncbi:MAG: hypothetical protein FWF28_00805 [Micrococcales bacterium]|nr:hypothetical protein [Micrococcales bacterium]
MTRELSPEQTVAVERAVAAMAARDTAAREYADAVADASRLGVSNAAIARALGTSGENVRKMISRRP